MKKNSLVIGLCVILLGTSSAYGMKKKAGVPKTSPSSSPTSSPTTSRGEANRDKSFLSSRLRSKRPKRLGFNLENMPKPRIRFGSHIPGTPTPPSSPLPPTPQVESKPVHGLKSILSSSAKGKSSKNVFFADETKSSSSPKEESSPKNPKTTP